MLARVHAVYRATGADLPFGDPLRAHGVAMEGYFWRVTDRRRQRSLIALIGVNRGEQPWATLGFAAGEVLALDAYPDAWADPRGLGARAGDVFVATRDHVKVDLGRGPGSTCASPSPVPGRGAGSGVRVCSR